MKYVRSMMGKSTAAKDCLPSESTTSSSSTVAERIGVLSAAVNQQRTNYSTAFSMKSIFMETTSATEEPERDELKLYMLPYAG